MARLVDCPSCGALRHATGSPCPHCDARGFSGQQLRRVLMSLAAGAAAFATVCCKYGRVAAVDYCRDPPDGGVGPEQCVPCTPVAGEDPLCVGGAFQLPDAGNEDAGTSDG
jgi:hypothetical protein